MAGRRGYAAFLFSLRGPGHDESPAGIALGGELPPPFRSLEAPRLSPAASSVAGGGRISGPVQALRRRMFLPKMTVTAKGTRRRSQPAWGGAQQVGHGSGQWEAKGRHAADEHHGEGGGVEIVAFLSKAKNSIGKPCAVSKAALRGRRCFVLVTGGIVSYPFWLLALHRVAASTRDLRSALPSQLAGPSGVTLSPAEPSEFNGGLVLE